MRNHTTGGIWAALTTGSELGAGWAADGPGGVRGPGDGAAVGPHVGSPGAPARCVWAAACSVDLPAQLGRCSWACWAPSPLPHPASWQTS